METPRAMPVVSASWKASVPMSERATWPVMTTSGMPSMLAVARPVIVFVAPGPEVTGRARVAVGHVRAALLVAAEDEVELRLREAVEDVQHGAAGIAEEHLDARLLQRLHQRPRAGSHLILTHKRNIISQISRRWGIGFRPRPALRRKKTGGEQRPAHLSSCAWLTSASRGAEDGRHSRRVHRGRRSRRGHSRRARHGRRNRRDPRAEAWAATRSRAPCARRVRVR